MKVFKFKNKKIKLANSNKVFTPNLTTQAIVEASEKLKFNKRIKVLDLGSGSGVIGIYLKKRYGKKIDLYLSDKEDHTINIINSNLRINKVSGFAKKSDILKNWEKDKFDLIINDISAISTELAKKHWYNKYIPHQCGKDGIRLSRKFLDSVKKNLSKKAIILMPIISISNHKLIIKLFKKKFKTKLLLKKEWPIPKILLNRNIEDFIKKGYIYKKYNTYLCFTKVYKFYR